MSTTDPAAPQPPVTPAPPQVEHAPQTPEEVQSLAQEFAKLREEMAQFRTEQQQARIPRAAQPEIVETPEEREAKRVEEISKFSHYCPACGRLYNYMRECTGYPASPHPPVDTVSTDELAGDPANYTKAPNTDESATAIA
jgi:hypothetical protein